MEVQRGYLEFGSTDSDATVVIQVRKESLRVARRSPPAIDLRKSVSRGAQLHVVITESEQSSV
jgi:hypothetical protein